MPDFIFAFPLHVVAAGYRLFADYGRSGVRNACAHWGVTKGIRSDGRRVGRGFGKLCGSKLKR